jgi:glucosamine kinase
VRRWTALLRSVFERFEADAYAIVRWMRGAGPRDYASLAPLIVAHAERGNAAGRDLLRIAAAHIDVMAARLLELGARRLSLMGGLSDRIEPYLSEETRDRLVAPLGDALSGALELARAEALRLHSHMAASDV